MNLGYFLPQGKLPYNNLETMPTPMIRLKGQANFQVNLVVTQLAEKHAKAGKK